MRVATNLDQQTVSPGYAGVQENDVTFSLERHRYAVDHRIAVAPEQIAGEMIAQRVEAGKMKIR